MHEWVGLLGGALLLYLGAEWFVGGASALALALRVPQLLVGLTVVAYGTSAPEIIVGVQAAASGHGEVALGNVIGSNIANIGLILGVSSLISPARVDASLARRELPVLVACTAILPWLLWDGVVSAWEGAALLVLAVVYSVVMGYAARSAAAIAGAREDVRATLAAADLAGAPTTVGPARALVTAAVGLVVLLVGGSLFVDGAVSVARTLQVSDRLIGLTVVAVGTSLPELVTSVIAARRGHSDLAVGNVVGSNIFNTLLCLGASALAGAVSAPLSSVAVDLGALGVMTLLIAAFIRGERIISRGEGALALALYFAFTTVAALRG